MPHIHISTLRRSLERDSLPAFIRAAWPIVEPAQQLKWGWHLDEICDALTEITRGNLKRLLINVPPGTGKSLTVSVFWLAWWWAKEPALGYLTASYSDANPIRDNLRFRRIITSPWFIESFWTGMQTGRDGRLICLPGDPSCTVGMRSDQNAKIKLENTAGGWRIATSVGGQGTGDHPDAIVIDDALKAQDARSKTMLANCNDWKRDVISTRRARDPVEVTIMQRLALGDLSAHTLDQGGCEHLCLPMRYVSKPNLKCTCHDGVPDKRDRRTVDGELLCPNLWPEGKVAIEENDLGPMGTSGQLQQNPVPEGGGLFKVAHFSVVETWPTAPGVRWCRGWDTATTADGGDWTVGVLLAELDGVIYVVDVIRLRGEPDEVDAAIRDAARNDSLFTTRRPWSMANDNVSTRTRAKHVACYTVVEEIDHKSIRVAHAKMLKGFNYEGVVVTTSKTHRAVEKSNSFRSQCGAGNVRMVQCSTWNAQYLDVMTTFPVGLHDDDVDATSVAWNKMVDDSLVVRRRGTFGQRRRGLRM